MGYILTGAVVVFIATGVAKLVRRQLFRMRVREAVKQHYKINTFTSTDGPLKKFKTIPPELRCFYVEDAAIKREIKN